MWEMGVKNAQKKNNMAFFKTIVHLKTNKKMRHRGNTAKKAQMFIFSKFPRKISYAKNIKKITIKNTF